MMKNKMLSALLLLVMIVGNNVAKAGEIVYGYCDDEIKMSFGPTSDYYGRCGIYITAETARQYKGKKLVGLKCGFYGSASEASIYVAKDKSTKYEAQKNVGSVSRGWQRIDFDTPYEIDGEPFYVGFMGKGTFFMGYGNIVNTDGAWYAFGLGNDLRHYEGEDNAVNVRMIVDTGEEESNDVKLIDIKKMNTQIDTPFNIYFTAKNDGTEKVTSIVVEYTLGNNAPERRTVNVNIEQGSTEECVLSEVPGYSQEGREIPVKVKVIGINGADVTNGSEATGAFDCYKILTKRRLVIEEKTGTWCGFCTRGIKGAEYMDKYYPEDFIMIAVHGRNGDPFQIADYASYINDGRGFPSARANRIEYDISASDIGFEGKMKETLEEVAVASVEVEATMSTATSKNFTAKVKVQFPEKQADKNYRIGFVMTEDGIRYNQTDFEGILGGGSPVEISHKHIARKVYEYNGYEGSVPADIEAEAVVNFEKTLAWPDNVVNKGNTHLIAMLYDVATGEIMNAAKTVVKEAGQSGVENIVGNNIDIRYENGNFVADNANVMVYTTSGVLVSNNNLAKGVYVVKAVRENGTTVHKFVIR